MSESQIQLSDHFTYSRLIRFVAPSIAMMVFTSIYSVVDGYFVSNYVGVTGFAAINLSLPILMFMSCLGFLFGTGGTAIVSRSIGEGDVEKANRYFSLICYTILITGVVIVAVSYVIMPSIADWLGATGQLKDNFILYGRITMLSTPLYMMQTASQSFFAAAERPKMGMYMTVVAGFTNILLDYILVARMGFGITGASVATCVTESVAGLVALGFFVMPNGSLLRIGNTSFESKVLLETCTNGASELMSSLSSTVVGVLCNYQLMKFGGEHGVAAYGVIMYVGFVFISIFLGYAYGVAPIVGYNYGAENGEEQKNIFAKSIRLIALAGISMTILARVFAPIIGQIYVGYDGELLATTVNGMRIYMLSYLLCGFNIFGSSYFTALSNGAVSAAISALRSFVFQAVCLVVIPMILGINGVWSATLVAETLTLVVTVVFILKYRSKYNYL